MTRETTRAARPAGARRGRLIAAAVALAASATPHPAGAGGGAPIEHEPIPPDPREDLAMGVVLEGDIPAAALTPSGVVGAPDPLRPPSPSEAAYAPGAGGEAFAPDLDTRRPEVTAYDDPFTPSTAPFKRLRAFDAVRGDYTLYVRDERRAPMETGGAPAVDEDTFFADMVVDLSPERDVLVPSVGPGARIVRARLGDGAREIPCRFLADGAGRWFVEPLRLRAPLRARLVMQLAIARDAFDPKTGDPAWGELPPVAPLPEGVARDAAQVRRAIGVSRAVRPREAIARLVEYFRGFASSDEAPEGRGSVYLDLALSRRGVCRHRAFAFMVTAQSLGIPARMIENEAHAWVEVHDGTRWRRIDLGGEGGYVVAGAGAGAGASVSVSVSASVSVSVSVSASVSVSVSAGAGGKAATGIVVAVGAEDVLRGAMLPVAGTARAEGEACAHMLVQLWLRSVVTGEAYLFATAATGDDGAFAGGGVVPSSVPLGDYDVVATTPGDWRCAPVLSKGPP